MIVYHSLISLNIGKYMDVKYLVVHQSDSPDDMYVDAPMIHVWHLQRQFSGIGYHYVILRSGFIEGGRPEYWQGAHVKGHNHESLGICLIGRNEFTREQYSTLRILLSQTLACHPDAEVVGHGDLDTAKYYCPGFDVRAWWANLT